VTCEVRVSFSIIFLGVLTNWKSQIRSSFFVKKNPQISVHQLRLLIRRKLYIYIRVKLATNPSAIYLMKANAKYTVGVIQASTISLSVHSLGNGDRDGVHTSSSSTLIMIRNDTPEVRG